MKIFLVLIFSILHTSWCTQICFDEDTSSAASCYPDYYWRDFRGKIPEDAIEGGRSPSGQPFYVAQAYFRGNELLPASVFPDESEAVASAYNKVLKTSTHVKVLCSKHKNNFKWLAIESQNLSKLTNTHIVIGGSEVGQVLYVGRVFDQTSTVLGKIFKHSLGNRGIWVPSNGHEANYLSYEILAYVCPENTLTVNSE